MNIRPASGVAILVAAAAALLLAGTAANAATGDTYIAYEGSDYGYSQSPYRTVWACDGEWDGRNVYVQYHRANSSSVLRVDTSRGAGTCDESPWGDAIVDFRICENVPLAADPCSSWRRVY